MVRLVGFNSCIFFFSTFGCAFYQAWSIKGEKRCDWGPFGRWATCGVHQRAIRMMRRDERLQKPGRPHSVRPQLHTQHKMCPIGMTMPWMKWHTIYRYNNIYTVVSWGAQDRRLCCVAWMIPVSDARHVQIVLFACICEHVARWPVWIVCLKYDHFNYYRRKIMSFVDCVECLSRLPTRLLLPFCSAKFMKRCLLLYILWTFDVLYTYWLVIIDHSASCFCRRIFSLGWPSHFEWLRESRDTRGRDASEFGMGLRRR